MRHIRTSRSTAPAIALAGLLCLVIVGITLAQEGGDAAQVRQREQVQKADQDPQGDALRQRIRERIENEEGLQVQERERLRQHLGECKELGIDDETTAALFDETEPLKNQIRIQERVLAMAREGLPLDPVMKKLQEGRQKGANNQVLEQVCTRVEAHVRTASRFMKRAQADGVKPDTPDAERRQTCEMATHMWRGLKEEDMDQLRERARLRLREGSCTTEELTVAAETATGLHEMRIERQRAVRLAGEALQNGYTVQEMKQLRWMVMTARMHGGPNDDVLDTLEQGLRNQHQLTHMIRQMQQHGWMGPADEHGGRGGRTPDDARGSGPGGNQGDDKGQGGKGQGGGGGSG